MQFIVTDRVKITVRPSRNGHTKLKYQLLRITALKTCKNKLKNLKLKSKFIFFKLTVGKRGEIVVQI